MRAVAAHPGWAATNLQSRSGNRVENALMTVGNRLLAQSGDMGALPTLYAATQDVPGDSYVGPDGRFEMRGHPTLVGRSAAAEDLETAAACGSSPSSSPVSASDGGRRTRLALV